ncbi:MULTISPECIES: HAD family phosphatase [unclassified Frigoribacterium]|uniref:HAD family hydrolase n=1 Tax=unclassified Frigoribacterium TaxID=2627005 RepID=UPI000F4A0E2F|nr:MULTISPECIES: HAD family phosphatase [unclassified Frigoribacterium]ROP78063.1 putative hydrolase of the HAD superfamily [Frigoribacterium sp. PhB107]TDT65905.1 putative hydrolase of the HAD superfamily [Frigoribacterium sp. PhB116]
MSISIPGRTVVFDYGEVISRFPDDASRRRIEELAGVEPAALWPSYGAHRHALDHGRLTATAYWRAVEADTGADWSRTRVHELWAADFPSWFVPEPGTLDVIADLADGGTRLAILSNAGQDFASPFRHSPLGDLFEQVFVSAELDDLKPSASIFRHVLAELGTTAADTVFIDNRPDNVEAAQALGITGHLFTGPEPLRLFVEGLAGLPTERR